MAADDDPGRLSGLSYEQLQQLHEQVLENWTQQGGAGDGSEYDVLLVPGVRAGLIIVYVIIIIIGLLGNGLVVAVAASRVSRPSPAARSSLQVRLS